MIILGGLLFAILLCYFMGLTMWVGPFAFLGCFPAVIVILWMYRKWKVDKFNRTFSSREKTKEEFVGEVKEYAEKKCESFFLGTSNSGEYEVKCFSGSLYEYAEKAGLEIVVKQCGSPDDDYPNADGIYMDVKECWKIENGKKTILHQQ